MSSQDSQTRADSARQELAKRELARRRFLPFVQYSFEGFKVNWHHKVIADALERIESGELKRLMVFIPPRHSKSEMVSIHFPAWALGRNKDRKIIEASYSSGLAEDFGRQTRNLVGSVEYGNVFDTKLAEDSKAKAQWNTNGDGAYNAVGVGGSLTGKGADILIIDDPLKNRADAESFTVREGVYSWYKSTARTRLSPEGAIIVVCTRWHDEDLAGKILTDDTENQWEIISIPAIAEEDEKYRRKGEALWEGHFGLENLLSTKKDLGTYEWSALYQQNPINSESQEFRPHFFRTVTADSIRNLPKHCSVTIDGAVSENEASDYTGVVINWTTPDQTWNIKAYHKKLGPMDFINEVFDIWDTHHPDVIGVEDTVFQKVLYPFMLKKMKDENRFFNIVSLKHQGKNKNLRIRGIIPRYESDMIRHIEGECDDLETEALRFPKGKHDDILDALAYQPDVAQVPEYPRTVEQDAREQMELDPRTGYWK